jgi:phosphate:Na+ symporter
MTPGDLFSTEVLALLGGVGMILFGMQTMTAALKELAGGSARAALERFTRTPLTGVATGAVATAVVQSSHATTLMTIGFVGAGMLSFPQALGILFGANIGTTATGWIVVLVGFKLQLGVVALPLLFAASLLAVLGGAQWARLGRCVAGFALLFIGIDAMQAGMAGSREV